MISVLTPFGSSARSPAEDEVVDEAYDEERLAELEEEQKAKEARSRAEVLEIIGDIKSADMKPPENVRRPNSLVEREQSWKRRITALRFSS
mmetsp:Transcript_39344/g.156221  ORF Transcript_39344/g.156221 Transcript_39344/m.156221 type:complete len:91 (-) Transcript_39344:5-277(-)